MDVAEFAEKTFDAYITILVNTGQETAKDVAFWHEMEDSYKSAFVKAIEENVRYLVSENVITQKNGLYLCYTCDGCQVGKAGEICQQCWEELE